MEDGYCIKRIMNAEVNGRRSREEEMERLNTRRPKNAETKERRR